ncbi:DUF1254 domain-containing protein [Microbacterium sp. M3]|uniref:DUF1254 domain-containing protein n=1 Tax=Microbacterium arthrosphaerae TaxID=792652 RepID=A0ABU4H6F9_9MICO|nr:MULTISPECIES: DUF1254 domain-containing protein [Microbacterium]MDW4574229.1 DUF1254 domain-containing protein [Microbacterium arthrosphaerae]MDW7608084.1 DUF1254 domain-containing protein [Microbacterium sp. M3]
MTDLDTLATEAYVYGFPLVFNLEQVVRYATTGVGGNPQAPFNSFSHARTLATAADTFVSINNDTVYSMAQLDLGVGPVRLSVPASDRYYVLQFVDAWTNNFAYIGTRGTGNDAGEFLLVPPAWEGDAGGLTVVRVPTRVASIVGRWSCAGADDLPAVHALQDALVLAPLDADAVAAGVPAVGSQGDDALDFWEKYRVWSQAFPPAPRDEGLQASFAPLDLTGDAPVGAGSAEQQAALRAGAQAGPAVLAKAMAAAAEGGAPGAWSVTLHVFDYNLDFFEVGAKDDPAWKTTDPKVRIVERAVAAKAGLWGNHGYEAAYVMTFTDADGQPLTGEHDYELRLSPPPPVGAFWSVTMYSLPEFYLVANEIDRYSVGDRTPGIVTDADGGLTMRICRTRPSDPDAAANWLPAPEGAFRPILRMYMPGDAVLDGTYAPPPIARLGS